MTSSAATYTPAAYNSSKMNGTTTTTTTTTSSTNSNNNSKVPTPAPRTCKPQPSPLPLEIETLEEIHSPEHEHEQNHNHFHHHHHPDEMIKSSSQFPNSSTMDSGVEDCCEPIVQPSIELDETQGKRIHVRMIKQETTGFGFSVVWVSPPRIERLEKGKTADIAGLRIGDLIIGVNGEDVTTVANTTIYHNMKTTGNELELEVWRKNPPLPPVTSSPPASTASTGVNNVKSSGIGGVGGAQIGSMVMMLMTGTGTGHKASPNPIGAPSSSSSSSGVPVTSNHHQHQHVVNSHPISSPRHSKQASSSSSSPMQTTTTTNPNYNNNNHNTIHQQSHQHQHQHLPTGHHLSNNNNSQSTTTNVVPNVPQNTINVNSVPSASASAPVPPNVNVNSNTNHNNNNNPRLPPVSILKPPPPVPPTTNVTSNALITSHNLQRNAIMTKRPSPHPQPTLASSSWKIRFNVELLDNEEDSLKQFFICELKFLKKVVAALDRYLIPAQSNNLLTPQEIHSIFAHIITIITMTKRILQCVANGASKTGWRLGEILFSTHSDHLSELTSAYTTYAKNLGNSATILGEKIKLQEFARFVLETPVPKGHLDMTSLLFAPLEHLRNLCEICDEIVHHFDHWTDFGAALKECYADIIVCTDYMEPISHISMKKNPLLSVRDLEKRIVSTTCQPLKVNEKGRKWLFGSRLHRKEADGSWAPVWAFLFSDIIVLTSHTTRDRVFFVKENPIRLEDVVTLHFNLPRKNENEFRLLFGPEPLTGRFDGKKWLPIYRRPKSNQVILRTPNLQLKSIWKLLLQRQIITLNTRLSKSSSSNFSISEFCEKFLENEQTRTREEKIDEEPEEDGEMTGNGIATSNNNSCRATTATSSSGSSTADSTPLIDRKELHSSEQTKDPIKSLSGVGGSKDRAKVYTSLKSIKEFQPGKIMEEEMERESIEPCSGSSFGDFKGKSDQGAASVAAAAALELAKVTTTSPNDPYSAPSIKRPNSRIVQVPDHVGGSTSVQVSKVVGTPDKSKTNNNVATTTTFLADIHVDSQNPLVSSSPLTTNISTTDYNPVPKPPRAVSNQYQKQDSSVNSTVVISRPSSSSPSSLSNDKDKVHKSPSTLPPLDLTSNQASTNRAVISSVTSSDIGSDGKDVIRLTKTLNTTNARNDSNSNAYNKDSGILQHVKIVQRPVEMLVSPSEGSPLRSYLNLRNSNSKTVVRTGEESGEGLNNNNNESIHDLNHQTQNPDSKCDCKISSSSTETHLKDEQVGGDKNVFHPLNTNIPPNASKDWMSKNSNQNSSLKEIYERPQGQLMRQDSLSTSTCCDNKCSNNDYIGSDIDVTKVNKLSMAKKNITAAENGAKFSLTQQQQQQQQQQNMKFIGGNENVVERSLTDISCTSSSSQTMGNRILKGDMPGPKIMTNAILKNRQQEVMAAVTAAALSAASGVDKFGNTCSEFIAATAGKISPLTTTRIGVLDKSHVQNKPSTSQDSLINGQRHVPAVKNVIAPSKYEQQKCCTDNTSQNGQGGDNSGSNSCAKGTVFTNSPIVSGFGSDRSRRRLLYDYKVRRDYPELFGISPRDRRSFIKMLGDKGVDSENPLVTPYYYHTRLSPLPQLKQSVSKNGHKTETPPEDENSVTGSIPTATTARTSSQSAATASGPVSTINQQSLLTGKNGYRNRLQHIRSLDDDEDDASTSTGSIHVNRRKNNGNNNNGNGNNSNGCRRDVDEDSDGSESGVDRVRDLIERVDDGHRHRRRSPEESSSNDSGISEEILILTDNQTKMISSSTTEASEDMNTSESDPVKPLRFASPSPQHEHHNNHHHHHQTSSSNDKETEVITSPINLTKCASSSTMISVAPPSTITVSTTTSTIINPPSVSHNNNSSSNNCCGVSIDRTDMDWTNKTKSNDKSSYPTTTINTNNNAKSNACNNNMCSSEATIVLPTTSPQMSKLQENSNTNSSAYALNTTQYHQGRIDNVDDDGTSTKSTTTHTNANANSNTNTNTTTQLSPSHVNSKMNHVCFVEGETTNDGVEAMVELTKADKATTTEDDDYMDFTWLSRLPEKSYRSLMAERREAFFLTNNHHPNHHPHPHSPYHQHRFNSNSSTITSLTSSSQASSYSANLPPSASSIFTTKEPVVVKIFQGGTLQTTTAETQSSPKLNSNNCERVMYTRLEQEKMARVERVESSDDSTSSDVASASPAAENGTTDPSWSSSSSSLAGYSSSILKEEQPCPSTCSVSASTNTTCTGGYHQSPSSSNAIINSPSHSLTNGYYGGKNMLVSSFLDNRSKPEIVVTKDSPETPKNGYSRSYSDDNNDNEDEDEEPTHCSVLSNGQEKSRSSGKSEFLRVESNDSTAENYGDDDDYNFDDDDEDLSHCSVATMNRYGTFESLEKIESEDTLANLPEFTRNMTRSKARFTFDDDDDEDDEDLFEEDFESDFNFRFPSQIQDNTYSVSRLGPLPPLLEEDYEDDMYEEHRETSPSNSSGGDSRSPHNQIHQAGVRGNDNSFLLARIATMYARSSISPLKIFRDLWLKKRYRQWAYKE